MPALPPLTGPLSFAACVCIMTAGPVRATRLDCPPELPAEALRFASAPPGWIGSASLPLRLRSAGFMQDEPGQQAQLRPRSIRTTSKGSVLAWRFEGPFPHGKWLSCGYGDGISLSRRIEDTFTRCSIVYRKTGGATRLSSIDCR